MSMDFTTSEVPLGREHELRDCFGMHNTPILREKERLLLQRIHCTYASLYSSIPRQTSHLSPPQAQCPLPGFSANPLALRTHSPPTTRTPLPISLSTIPLTLSTLSSITSSLPFSRRLRPRIHWFRVLGILSTSFSASNPTSSAKAATYAHSDA